MAEDFETVLEDCGSYGKFQKTLLYGLLLPYSFILSLAVSKFKIYKFINILYFKFYY